MSRSQPKSGTRSRRPPAPHPHRMPRSSSSSEASTTDGDERSSMCSPRDTTRTKGSPLSEEFVTLPQAQCGIIKERTQDAEGVV